MPDSAASLFTIMAAMLLSLLLWKLALTLAACPRGCFLCDSKESCVTCASGYLIRQASIHTQNVNVCVSVDECTAMQDTFNAEGVCFHERGLDESSICSDKAIATEEDLQKLANCSGVFLLIRDINVSQTVASSLTLLASVTFDGNGHTIFVDNFADGPSVGLFSNLLGSVRNLTLQGSYEQPAGSVAKTFGMLSGQASGASIAAVRVILTKVYISLPTTLGGGLLGVVQGSQVEQCQTEMETVEVAGSFGGLVGELNGGSEVSDSLSIINHFNVQLKQEKTEKASCGGLIGAITGAADISRTYTHVEQLLADTSTGAGSAFLGGLAGSIALPAPIQEAVKIQASFAVIGALHLVQGGAERALFAGAFLGQATATTDSQLSKSNIEACWATAHILVDGPALVKSTRGIGGFAGRIYNGIRSARCFALGSLRVPIGSFYAGAFFGETKGTSSAVGCYSAVDLAGTEQTFFLGGRLVTPSYVEANVLFVKSAGDCAEEPWVFCMPRSNARHSEFYPTAWTEYFREAHWTLRPGYLLPELPEAPSPVRGMASKGLALDTTCSWWTSKSWLFHESYPLLAAWGPCKEAPPCNASFYLSSKCTCEEGCPELDPLRGSCIGLQNAVCERGWMNGPRGVCSELDCVTFIADPNRTSDLLCDIFTRAFVCPDPEAYYLVQGSEQGCIVGCPDIYSSRGVCSGPQTARCSAGWGPSSGDGLCASVLCENKGELEWVCGALDCDPVVHTCSCPSPQEYFDPLLQVCQEGCPGLKNGQCAGEGVASCFPGYYSGGATLCEMYNCSADPGIPCGGLGFCEGGICSCVSGALLLDGMCVKAECVHGSVVSSNCVCEQGWFTDPLLDSNLCNNRFCESNELLSTEADLDKLYLCLESSFVLTADISLTKPLQPIREFLGMIDGMGHTLSNLSITFDENSSVVALFVDSLFIIQNITIEANMVVHGHRLESVGVLFTESEIESSALTVLGNLTVMRNGTDPVRPLSVGCVAGRSGPLVGVSADCVVACESFDADCHVGIVAGEIVGRGDSSDLVAKGAVSCKAPGCLIGGLVGLMQGVFLEGESWASLTAETGSKECQAGGVFGNLQGDALAAAYRGAGISAHGKGALKVGGLAGQLTGAYVAESVSYTKEIAVSSQDGPICLGGFVGELIEDGASVEESYSVVKILQAVATDSAAAFVGGFAGRVAKIQEQHVRLHASYATTEQVIVQLPVAVEAELCAGGFLGALKEQTADAELTSLFAFTQHLIVQGTAKLQAGGFFGLLSAAGSSLVSSCWATMELVTESPPLPQSSIGGFGGLLGELMTLQDCYAFGQVQSLASASFSPLFGSFVGEISGDSAGCITSYSAVAFPGGEAVPFATGGILLSCFYDGDSQGSAPAGATEAVPLYGSDKFDPINYLDFDAAIWEFHDAQMPSLKGMPNEDGKGHFVNEHSAQPAWKDTVWIFPDTLWNLPQLKTVPLCPYIIGTAGICTSCMEGPCDACEGSCAPSIDGLSCISCSPDTALPDNTDCSAPDCLHGSLVVAECISCASSNPAVCSLCSPGFAVRVDANLCEPCSSRCLDCASLDPDECISCREEDVLDLRGSDFNKTCIPQVECQGIYQIVDKNGVLACTVRDCTDESRFGNKCFHCTEEDCVVCSVPELEPSGSPAVCSMCEIIPEACLSCEREEGHDVCRNCSAGHALAEDRDACLACQASKCFACEPASLNVCTSCHEGDILDRRQENPPAIDCIPVDECTGIYVVYTEERTAESVASYCALRDCSDGEVYGNGCTACTAHACERCPEGCLDFRSPDSVLCLSKSECSGPADILVVDDLERVICKLGDCLLTDGCVACLKPEGTICTGCGPGLCLDARAREGEEPPFVCIPIGACSGGLDVLVLGSDPQYQQCEYQPCAAIAGCISCGPRPENCSACSEDLLLDLRTFPVYETQGFCISRSDCVGMLDKIMDNGECVSKECAAILGCLSCDPEAEEKCLSCEEGRTLSPDQKSCRPPCNVSGCEVCAESSPLLCLSCQDYHGLLDDGSECVPCEDSICRLCSAAQPSFCLFCDPGLAPSEGHCKTCQTGQASAGDRCIACSFTEIVAPNADVCLACPPGLFSDASRSECAPEDCLHGEFLVEHCYICKQNETSQCDSCLPGWRLDTLVGFCEQYDCLIGGEAVENCGACSAEAPLLCSSCISEHYDLDLKDNTCTETTCLTGSRTVPSCLLCDETNHFLCSECAPWYILDEEHNTCTCFDPEFC